MTDVAALRPDADAGLRSVARRWNDKVRALMPRFCVRQHQAIISRGLEKLMRSEYVHFLFAFLSVMLTDLFFFSFRAYFYFQLVILISNVIILALINDVASYQGHMIVVHINLALLVVFALDIIICFLADGFVYFLDVFNLFDLLVFAVSIIGQVYLYGAFYRVSEGGGTCSHLVSFVLPSFCLFLSVLIHVAYHLLPLFCLQALLYSTPCEPCALSAFWAKLNATAASPPLLSLCCPHT